MCGMLYTLFPTHILQAKVLFCVISPFLPVENWDTKGLTHQSFQVVGESAQKGPFFLTWQPPASATTLHGLILWDISVGIMNWRINVNNVYLFKINRN